MSKLKTLDPRDYYQSLRKKDKGKFLRYLSKRYDYSTTTMSGKLRLNALGELRKDEREILIKTIEEDLWRR